MFGGYLLLSELWRRKAKGSQSQFWKIHHFDVKDPQMQKPYSASARGCLPRWLTELLVA